MKTISLILLLTFIPFFKNFGYTLIFESEKVFIKTDTASFYGAISNKYPTDQISQIKKEILRRYAITQTEEIQMDKMSLKISNEKNEKDFLCLSFEKVIIKLMNSQKAKVYYKSCLTEITSWNIKRKGPNEKGEIRIIYRDKKNYKHFITEIHHVCIGPRYKFQEERDKSK
ncbi:MAG: hypothetical protein NVV82_04000 [Sporocytophaga sp.]|nr:hypothetical protein [Sporocytophaga sp.]